MADERNRMLEQLNTDDWQECRQSVLIVDDSAMNRRMLTEILGGRFDTAEATSGEERLSNFLLWQLAYTEFYFTDVPWPDFKKEELVKAIEKYNERDRRYGGVKEE